MKKINKAITKFINVDFLNFNDSFAFIYLDEKRRKRWINIIVDGDCSDYLIFLSKIKSR